MSANESKNVFLRIVEDFGLIIGGLILLFAILFGVAWLLTGPLQLSPNSSTVLYGLGIAFLISLVPFWLIYRHRANENPQEALRIYKYFLIYAIWCGISGIAGTLAV